MAKSKESEHLAGVLVTSEFICERNCCPEQCKQLLHMKLLKIAFQMKLLAGSKNKYIDKNT